jgi:hypothetical protein
MLIGRIALALSLTLLMAATALADTKALERVFQERAAISAADERCALFTEGERYALKSGFFQSRNELLRNNYRPAEIEDLASDARSRVKGLACDNAAIRDKVATIRESYRMFAKTNYLEYNSAHGHWGASRIVFDQWAVMEADATTRVAIGLRRGGPDSTARLALPRSAGSDLDLRFAVALPAGAWSVPPASVQLRMRDPQKLSQPWLGALRGATPALSTPPRSVSRVEWAGGFGRQDDITRQPFLVYYFPAAVAARIEALDPRESIEVEVTPSPRASDQKVKSYLFEVGDFSAAVAFAMIPQPVATSQVAEAHH